MHCNKKYFGLCDTCCVHVSFVCFNQSFGHFVRVFNGTDSRRLHCRVEINFSVAITRYKLPSHWAQEIIFLKFRV